MTILSDSFLESVSVQVCGTLAHSIWQVALVALVIRMFERVALGVPVTTRYWLHAAGILASLAMMVTTYFMLIPAGASPDSPNGQTAWRLAINHTTLSPANLVPATEEGRGVVVDPKIPASGSTSDSEPTALPDMPASFAASSRWQGVLPWVCLLYAVGVLAMLSRLAISAFRSNRALRSAEPVTQGVLVDLLAKISNEWMLRVTPRLLMASDVAIPKVVGILKPTIVVPMAAVSGLTPDQMRLVLMHELAHVRRLDLWVNLLQRLAESILFFNPALWHLSHRTSLLREYCCDEMVCKDLATRAIGAKDSVASRCDYAFAMVKVATLSRAIDDAPELTALAATGCSPSQLRRRIARLLGEPIAEPIGVTRNGFLIVALLSLLIWLSPAVRGVAPPDVPSDKSFQLTVLGPDGRAVPAADVQVRSGFDLSAERIRRGTYLKNGTYGNHALTDAEGVLSFQIREEIKSLALRIGKDGFAPYWAEWRFPQYPDGPPEAFTATLDQAWSVGGVLLDENQNPIVDAEVSPSVYFKFPPGIKRQLGVGTTIKTDASGHWRYNSVPNSKTDVFVSFNHPEFSPLRISLSRDGYELPLDSTPSQPIVMTRGLVVNGTVTDSDGNPIPDAYVFTKFLNDIRETQTDADGRYRLSGCEPRTTRLVVYAKGFATDMQEIRVDPNLGPVDFSLKSGGHIRVRVVDENGVGVPKSRIFFQRWRGHIDYFEFKHVNQYTDDQGVWEWNEAPLDEFKADICRAGGMQLSDQPLLARDEEYVFSPPKTLQVGGKVTNRTTGKPISRFTVTPGLRNEYTAGKIDWIESDRYEASDGNYRVRFSETMPANVVRIEADGYKSLTTRDVKPDEGNVTIDLELTPAENLSGLIQSYDGKPAANASIAIGEATSQIRLDNGRIDDGSTYATVVQSDSEGRFSFPDRGVPIDLVIAHPLGVAHVRSTDGPIPQEIALMPWASVEGVFYVNGKPAANIPLTLNSDGIGSYGKDIPNIFTQHRTTTGEQGQFRFDRVIPGSGTLGREITLMVDDGATEVTSSVRMPMQFTAGQTQTIELGRQGRSVIGQLVAPGDHVGQVFWNFALIDVQIDLPTPEQPPSLSKLGDDTQKRAEWFKSPEGKAWLMARTLAEHQKRLSPQIRATVDRDGTFHIDDVPAGSWNLSARFSQHDAGSARNVKFKVALPKGSTEPIDLGQIPLSR